MTSVEAYNFGMRLANRAVNGGYPVPDFNTFINMAQDLYLDKLTENGLDMSMGGNEQVGAFIVRRTVPVTDGYAIHNPYNDLAFGPEMWVSGYVNPDCGDPAPEVKPILKMTRLTSAEWAERSTSYIDTIDRKHPCWMLRDAVSALVLPASVGFVTAWYLRRPRRIVVGSVIDPSGVERPQEGAPNQVDPEWSNGDMVQIIALAMTFTGLQLQNDRMQMFGRAVK